MQYLGNLSSFEHQKCEWSIFKSKLTQFLKINDVTEENKSAILITHLSDESYRLLRNLAYPEEIEKLSYKKLVELLDKHFKPKGCTFADKAKFYGATRKSGEKLGDWAARLRGLASYCDFGAALETSLTDRFVLGLGPGPEREKLFEQNASKLTLARALEIAEQAESAREAQTVVSSVSAAVEVKEEKVYKVSCGRARGGYGADAAGKSRSSRYQGDMRCAVCGMQNHDTEKCRYKNYKCQKCGKRGHLKKVCGVKNKNSQVRLNNIVSDNSVTETEDECDECQNFKIRYVTDNPLHLKLKLGNEPIVMELDSGSGVTVISKFLYKKMFAQYQLIHCKLKMCLYNGHKISPLGYFWIEANYENKIKQIRVFVVDSNGPALLGRDFMSTFNLVLTSNINNIYHHHDTDVNTILESYPNLWKDELGSFNKFKVHLQLKDNAQPKFFKARTVPFALKDKVENELNRLVSLGILRPVNHSSYATPIVPVLKSDGTVKIAGDYSVTLNKDMVVDKYPLPRIEEVFANLGGGEHYSKIDLKNAYNQFILSDESQELTTISTSKGLFCYTRLVYGRANAPAIFQKSMELLLSGIEGVSIWLDDVCLTAPTKEIHLQRLRQVLSRLDEAGLRLHKDKCSFLKNSVTYLGYVIYKQGLRTSRDKVKAILKAPEPTNVTEVKRFLGVVNYYRNFIPNASSIMSPLHELLRADARWQWDEPQRRAVRRVRAELASERVLAHFEPGAQLVLAVDAGPTGLGAVLSQRGGDGQERPLAFASRSLTPSERNYSQIQKEATAIIFGVKHFHQYLYGRNEPFILKTDHRPLVSIFNNKTGISVSTALRLQRYAIILSAYNYTVQYTSSENNLVADYFSRAPMPDAECESDREYDALCSLKFLDANQSAVLFTEIRDATSNDKTLQTVIKYMHIGWPRKIMCNLIRPYFLCRTDLQYENGILLRGHKVVIPLSLRERSLNELHSTHLGIVKMKCNARSRMWWPGIDSDIETWCASCEVCAGLRPAPPRADPAPWPRPAGPWQRIHIDYLSIGQRVYLVVIDAYSKWLECVYMHSGVTTQNLINKLKPIFSVFGIPNSLVSDNDIKINSKEFNEFCNSNGIEYITSPIYHPCSNGQAENSVRVCKKMLKCIIKVSAAPNVIQEQLLGYLFEYRNTVHCSTGHSPAKLMFGRNLRSRLDLLLPENKKHKHGTATSTTRYFKIGDRVRVRWYSARQESWKIGSIDGIIGKRMFKVLIDGSNITCIRHIDQLLHYKGFNSGSEISQNVTKKNVPPTSSPVSFAFSPPEPSAVQGVDNNSENSSTTVERESGDASSVCAAETVTDARSDESRLDGGVERVDTRQGTSAVVSTVTAADTETAPAPAPPEPSLYARSRRPRKQVDYTKFF